MGLFSDGFPQILAKKLSQVTYSFKEFVGGNHYLKTAGDGHSCLCRMWFLSIRGLYSGYIRIPFWTRCENTSAKRAMWIIMDRTIISNILVQDQFVIESRFKPWAFQCRIWSALIVLWNGRNLRLVWIEVVCVLFWISVTSMTVCEDGKSLTKELDRTGPGGTVPSDLVWSTVRRIQPFRIGPYWSIRANFAARLVSLKPGWWTQAPAC